MEKINDRIFEANILLVDENRVLKRELKEKERIINKAIELIDLNICGGSISNAYEVLEVLKGED